jgi:hypothetical protein
MGKYKICMFSKYSRNNHSKRNTLHDQQLVNEDQKYILQDV